jgi:hypothetical protein
MNHLEAAEPPVVPGPSGLLSYDADFCIVEITNTPPPPYPRFIFFTLLPTCSTLHNTLWNSSFFVAIASYTFAIFLQTFKPPIAFNSTVYLLTT